MITENFFMYNPLKELFLFQAYLKQRDIADVFVDGDTFSPISCWSHPSPDGSGHTWVEVLASNPKGTLYIVNGMTDTTDIRTMYEFYISQDDLGPYLSLRKNVELSGWNFVPVQDI